MQSLGANSAVSPKGKLIEALKLFVPTRSSFGAGWAEEEQAVEGALDELLQAEGEAVLIFGRKVGGGSGSQRGKDGEEFAVDGWIEEAAAAKADAREMGGAGDDKDAAHGGASGEPSPEGLDFTESTPAAEGNFVGGDDVAGEAYEEVAFRRMERRGKGAQAEARGQREALEAANFISGDTEKDLGRSSLVVELQGVMLAAFAAGEDEDQIGFR